MSYVDNLFMEASRDGKLLTLKQATCDEGQIISDVVVRMEFRNYFIIFRLRRLLVAHYTWKNRIICSDCLEIHFGKGRRNDERNVVTNRRFSFYGMNGASSQII